MHNTLFAKRYAERSIRNYTREMRFLFAHYYDLLPESITQQDIINYICNKIFYVAGSVADSYYLHTLNAGFTQQGDGQQTITAIPR